MRVIIDSEKIKRNIAKAEVLAQGVPVSLLFKDFYEHIYSSIHPVKNELFSRNIMWSNCYAIGKAQDKHTGAVITSVNQLEGADYVTLKRVFIPINVTDNREGLTFDDAERLAYEAKVWNAELEVIGMITSGCLNERAPRVEDLWLIWERFKGCMSSLSIGGSYWLGKDEKLPDFIRDVRIGEYMLFGTIPYNNDEDKLGENAILIEAEVIGIYPERNHILIDCGYSLAEPDKCSYLDTSLFYVDSSSEYTILYTDTRRFKVGDRVLMKPNYKSLVKLKDAVRNYI